MNLLLDTPESGSCTREEAFDSRLVSMATNTYQPLPNLELVDMIAKVAQANDIKLVNEQLGMDLKGQRFFGVCDVAGKDFFGGKIRMMIGFCNSYNKSMSARVCIGGKVFVCSNRAFHAYTDELTGVSGMAVHEHRINVKDGLYRRIREAFGGIDKFRETQERFYDGLSSRKIRRERAYATIVKAAQAGVVNKTKVLTLANEWERQSKEPDVAGAEWHPEFRDRNAYSLFNAFTQIEKQRFEKNPVQSNIQTMALTQFFTNEFRLN